MSILDKMRSGTDSTFMQLMLGAVFVSFILFYAKPHGDQRGRVVATVNGVSIKDTDFNREYSRVERQYNGLSEEDKTRLQKMVTEELVRDEVIFQEADRVGLTVSPAEILRTISHDPSFSDDEGVFDVKQYETIIKRQGWSRPDYEQMVRDRLLRAKLIGLVSRAIDVSDADLKDSWTRGQTRIDVQWVRVAPLMFTDDVDLSTEAVAKFVSENADRIKSSYDADFDRLYNLPEKLRVSQIVLKLRDDGVSLDDLGKRIDDLQAQIAAGADFGTLAARYSEDPTAAHGGARDPAALGEFDSTSADALAKVEAGQLAKVVGTDSIRLYRVEERIPARVIPVTDAQDDIAKRIMREDGSPRLAVDYANKLLAAWKEAGSPPAAMLDAQQLTVESSGLFSPVEGPAKQGPPADLLRKLIDAPVGPPTEVFEDRGTYWLAGVDLRQDADLSKFDADRASMETQGLAERRSVFLTAWTTDLVAKAKVVNGS